MEIKINKNHAAISLTIKFVPLVAFIGLFGFFLTPLFVNKNIEPYGPAVMMAFSAATCLMIYLIMIAPWLSKIQAKHLSYSISDGAIHVKEGVLFKKWTSVPAGKITDIVLSQNPLQRIFNIWSIKIQTAGMGQKSPEVLMHGVIDAESVRAEILKESNKQAGEVRSQI